MPQNAAAKTAKAGLPLKAGGRPKKSFTVGKLRAKLNQYKIINRSSTMRHAFVNALAHIEPYDKARAEKALLELHLDPNDLACIYCRRPATTWDHLTALVSGKGKSGFGNQLGNLVPCCKDCNSDKSGTGYKAFVNTLHLTTEQKRHLNQGLARHLKKYAEPWVLSADDDALKVKLDGLLEKVLELLKKADDAIRKARKKNPSVAKGRGISTVEKPADIAAKKGPAKARNGGKRHRGPAAPE